MGTVIDLQAPVFREEIFNTWDVYAYGHYAETVRYPLHITMLQVLEDLADDYDNPVVINRGIEK